MFSNLEIPKVLELPPNVLHLWAWEHSGLGLIENKIYIKLQRHKFGIHIQVIPVLHYYITIYYNIRFLWNECNVYVNYKCTVLDLTVLHK